MITLDDIEKMKEVRRMRYFNELFLKQEEFVLDQNYHIRMRRLHNRHLHSHGIVWGLEVQKIPDKSTSVRISPGMALNKVRAVNEDDVSQEIILFAETKDFDLSGYDEGDGVYFYISRFEEKNYTDESKGGSEEINWLETAKVELIAVKPDNKPDNESQIILAKVKLINGQVHIETEDCIYAGAYGKLVLSVDGKESNLSIEGKKFDDIEGIRVNSPLTNFTGGLRIGDISNPGDKNLVVDGNCTVNGTLEVKSGISGGLHVGGTTDPGDKNLEVDGNCTIKGNLEVLGIETVFKTQTTLIKDNILTISNGTTSGIDSGIEVDRGEGEIRPQLLWIENDKRWKVSGIDGDLVNLGYGSDWDTLTDNSIADDLHRHTELVGKGGSPDPALSVDNNGNVGIGVIVPSEKLEVDGTVKATAAINAPEISGDTLNLSENAEIMGNVGIGAVDPESKLEVRNGDLLVQPAESMSGDYVKIHGSSPPPGPLLAEFIPDPVISFYEDGIQKADILWSKELKALLINDSAANTYINRNGGYVGIGTDEPSNELEVAGTVKAAAFLGDGSQLTGASQWVNDPSGIYYKNNVGIGTAPSATDRLYVDGMVKSTSINALKILGDSLSLAGNAEITGSVYIGGDLNVTGTVKGNLANDIVDTDQIKDNAVTEMKLEQAIRDKLANAVPPELIQEIVDARGIKASLGNRLDESLTKGGQLRSNVVGMDQLDDITKSKLLGALPITGGTLNGDLQVYGGVSSKLATDAGATHTNTINASASSSGNGEVIGIDSLASSSGSGEVKGLKVFTQGTGTGWKMGIDSQVYGNGPKRAGYFIASSEKDEYTNALFAWAYNNLGSGLAEGLEVIASGTGTGLKQGIVSSASGNGFKRAGQFIASSEEGTDTAQGLYIDASGTGTGEKQGIVCRASGNGYKRAGDFAASGGEDTYPTNALFASADSSGNGPVDGLYISTFGTGTGSKTGITSYASGNGFKRAGQFGASSGDGTDQTTALYANASSSGSGDVQGLDVSAFGTGTGWKFGIISSVSGNGNKRAGQFMAISEKDGETTSLFASARSSGSGNVFGLNTSVYSSGNGGVYGLYGYAYGEGEGPKYGVYGYAQGNGKKWAGYFVGDVHVNGVLSKSSGSFLIDHPLDPYNKTLRHSFVESPEDLCLYRGKVKLDSKGRATVKMPEYFSSLTKEDEATITLTPIGKKPFLLSYEWNSKFTAFTIHGEPDAEATYIVLADRDDPTIHNFRRPVEEDKGDGNFEKGKLLVPEAEGSGRKKGIARVKKEMRPVEEESLKILEEHRKKMEDEQRKWEEEQKMREEEQRKREQEHNEMMEKLRKNEEKRMQKKAKPQGK